MIFTLVRVPIHEKPPRQSWGPELNGRKGAFTIQAIRSKHRRPCRFCGDKRKGHRARDCDVPIFRGWGFPGWENLTPTRAALVAMGSPSK